ALRITPSHRSAKLEHWPSGRAGMPIPQPHEMIADNGCVGVSLLELLQAAVHRANELGRLDVLAGGDHVDTADPEGAVQHPETRRQPQPGEHKAALEIAGYERIGLLHLHSARAIQERWLTNRGDPLLRNPIAPLAVQWRHILVAGNADALAQDAVVGGECE